MSIQVSIFVPDDQRIPAEELNELTALDNVAAQVGADGRASQYRIAWEDVSLLIEFSEGEELEERLNELQLHVDDLLGGRSDKKAQKIWRRVERMVQIIDVTAAPEWDADRKAQQVVQGIMANYDYALMLADGGVYNENGNIEVGPEDIKPKYFAREEEEAEEKDEAIERKKRSIRTLKEEGVPYIQHLPGIATEDETTLRSVEEVAKRALVLHAVARRAEGESFEAFEERVKRYQVEDAITADEWEFVETEDPVEYAVLRFSQRYEGCWLLLWALGYSNRLSRPDSFCNAERVDQIIESRSPEQFILEAELRSTKEILDETDLHYRYHWAVVDAELYGRKPPVRLEPAVIFERHYALNWLIRYRNLEWDDMATDT